MALASLLDSGKHVNHLLVRSCVPVQTIQQLKQYVMMRSGATLTSLVPSPASTSIFPAYFCSTAVGKNSILAWYSASTPVKHLSLNKTTATTVPDRAASSKALQGDLEESQQKEQLEHWKEQKEQKEQKVALLNGVAHVVFTVSSMKKSAPFYHALGSYLGFFFIFVCFVVVVVVGCSCWL